MIKVIIAEFGMEGGGVTIFGNQSERGGTFWTEGISVVHDENDDEVWHSWSCEPVSDFDCLTISVDTRRGIGTGAGR